MCWTMISKENTSKLFEMKTKNMTILSKTLTILALFIAPSVFSQTLFDPNDNLILNGSFEHRRPNIFGDTLCPSGGGDIWLSAEWNGAEGSVDYFHGCSSTDYPMYGVPDNLIGSQSSYGEGEAYAAFATYTPYYENAREFLWQQLVSPLIEGQAYTVYFRVSLADSMNFAVSNIGVLFSQEDTRFWQIEDFFTATPQVESPDQLVLGDKENWMKISGEFVASGTERFVTIGVFHPDEDINHLRVSNYPVATFDWDVNSNYIDGVELYEGSATGIDDLDQPRITIYPNPATGGSVTIECKLKSGDKAELKVFDGVGRQVYNKTLRSAQGNKTIELNGLTEGIYHCVLVVNGKLSLSEKLVILRQ